MCEKSANTSSRRTTRAGPKVEIADQEEHYYGLMFAEAIGITPANLAVLKDGRAKAIRFSTLAAICREPGCHPGDILHWSGDWKDHAAHAQADPFAYDDRGACSAAPWAKMTNTRAATALIATAGRGVPMRDVGGHALLTSFERRQKALQQPNCTLVSLTVREPNTLGSSTTMLQELQHAL